MTPLTPGATKLAGAGGLLLTAALGWMLVIGPQVSALADVRLQMEDTSSQNDVLRLQLASLEKQGQALGETRRKADRLAGQFPPTADLPELFKTITAAAVDAGIGARGVTTLAPSAPVVAGTDPATGLPLAGSGADLARQTISISVTGTYGQTQAFLENLEQMTRAYLITSVALTGSDGLGTFTTSITGEMFVMMPLESPDQAVDDADQTGG